MENIPLDSDPAEHHQLLGDDASLARNSPQGIPVSSLSTPSSPEADLKGNKLKKLHKTKSWKRREKSKRASETLSTKVQIPPDQPTPFSYFFKNWGQEWASVIINGIIVIFVYVEFYKGGLVLNKHPLLMMNIIVSIIAVIFKTCLLLTVSNSMCAKSPSFVLWAALMYGI